METRLNALGDLLQRLALKHAVRPSDYMANLLHGWRLCFLHE
ncbi:hypothetical protein ABN079_19655 [Enterobacter hormaechei]|nr:hypothetical protein [Enterobacter hormaechei]MCU3014244.1 hypothetical protein [Enterobacter hormaechei subsp. oharae]MCU3615668.1 hypothetical protein [Enterobacter hormaechei subsp. oharae]